MSEQTNQLATVTQSIVPPPKKKDVIRATAMILAEEAAKKSAAKRAEFEKIKAQISALVPKLLKRMVREKKGTHSLSRYGNSVELSLRVTPADVPDLVALYDAKDDVEGELIVLRSQTMDHFVQKLTEAAKGQAPNPTVETLLNDPTIKSGLLKAGLALLAKPTAEDKAQAIAA